MRAKALRSNVSEEGPVVQSQICIEKKQLLQLKLIEALAASQAETFAASCDLQLCLSMLFFLALGKSLPLFLG